jgi:hypothetical protein
MDAAPTPANKSAIVLAVPHQLQGPGFAAFINDPAYRELVGGLIRGVDFVFEEAAGRGPSIAEELAKSLLEPGRYLDIDPPKDQRTKHGLAEATGGTEPIDVFRLPDTYRWELVDEHRKREELWLQRILDKSFSRGLVICGTAHGLSFAFRLGCAGIGAPQVCDYTPHDKLCRRTHS